MIFCGHCKKSHDALFMCEEAKRAFVGVQPPTAAVPLAPTQQYSGTATVTVGPGGMVAHPKDRAHAELMLSVALAWLAKHSRDHRHRNGGTYLKLATATVQTDTNLTDMDKVVVYVGEDGEWWARHPEEFNERFTKL